MLFVCGDNSSVADVRLDTVVKGVGGGGGGGVEVGVEGD